MDGLNGNGHLLSANVLRSIAHCRRIKMMLPHCGERERERERVAGVLHINTISYTQTSCYITVHKRSSCSNRLLHPESMQLAQNNQTKMPTL